MFALWSFFLLIAIQLLAINVWIWFPFWIAMLFIFMFERVFTVWKGGWRARLLALTIFPELFYDSYLDLIFLKGVLDIAFKRQAQWGNEAAVSEAVSA